MTPLWPTVQASLVAVLPTVLTPDVVVYDTQAISGDDPDAWVTVGFVTGDNAGQFNWTRDSSGFTVDEVGDVKLHLVARSGDEGMAPVRAKVFSMAAAILNLVAADNTLGGRLPYLTELGAAVQVASVEDDDGVAQELVVNVTYQSVLQ